MEYIEKIFFTLITFFVGLLTYVYRNDRVRFKEDIQEGRNNIKELTEKIERNEEENRKEMKQLYDSINKTSSDVKVLAEAIKHKEEMIGLQNKHMLDKLEGISNYLRDKRK